MDNQRGKITSCWTGAAPTIKFSPRSALSQPSHRTRCPSSGSSPGQGTPAAKALMALVPRALSGTTLQSSPSNSLDRDQGQVKFDHSFSEANRFTASYFIEDSASVNPLSTAVPGFGNETTSRFQNAV